MRGRLAVIAASSLLLAGCTSTEDRLAKASESALSWIATARSACDHWQNGRASNRYLRATLQAAVRSLEAERSRLASSPHAVAEGRVQETLALLQDVEVAMSRLWAAVGHDRDRVLEERAALAGLEGRLRALGARTAAP